MIKNWKQFESFDEDDMDLARMEFDGSRGFISFQYRDFLIKGKDMDHLINFYIETRDRSGEWSGGPVNKEFDEYFKSKYKEFDRGREYGESNFSSNNPYKPAMGLTIDTEYGLFNTSYSFINNKPQSVMLEPFEMNSPGKGDGPRERSDIFNRGDIINFSNTALINYPKNSIGKSMSVIWRTIYYDGKLMDDLINYLKLDIVNY